MSLENLRNQVVEGHHRGLTLQEMGDEIGVTRERVRQVVKSMGLEMAGRQERRYATAISGRSSELTESFLRLRNVDLVADETGIEVDQVARFVEREIPDAKVLAKSRNSKTPKYTDSEYLECLRFAAQELDSPIGHAKYDEWAAGRSLPDGRRWPGPQGIMIRFGSWRESLLKAGLPANPSAGGSGWFDYDDFRIGVASAWKELGKPPTVSEYDSWAAGKDRYPSSATIRKQIDGWDQIMTEAWYVVHEDFVERNTNDSPSQVRVQPVSTQEIESKLPGAFGSSPEPDMKRQGPLSPSVTEGFESTGELLSAEWIFDRLPASKAREGGIAANQVFKADIDTFVREVLQNSLDQAIENEDKRKETVDVRFTLEKSSGDRMKSLLDAIGWETLFDHLEDSERHGGETISGRLREGLELVEMGSIRVLTVEDRNTKGLTGSEDGDSNFANLCRNQLVTSSDRKESGGSFGIGKSVLWLFSTLSTVLFSSRPADRDDLRFIGRTYLPSHDAFGTTWQGPGWFGTPEEDDGQLWAVSMGGSASQEIAERCGVFREPGEFGTSILILGFDDPSLEDEPSVADTCQAIQDSASRWYWPALENGSLTVEIVGTENGEEVFSGSASSQFPEVAPFVRAMTEPLSDSGILEEPGDVIEKHISVKIPARRNGKSGVVEAKARLRLRIDEPSEDETHTMEVALQRGTGMVVQNYSPRAKQNIPHELRGVLLAGNAGGQSPDDHALEEFLRASEPPAHNRWDHTTQRLKSEYMTPGRKSAIENIYRQIDDAFGELATEITADTDAVPDFLRKMLPLGGSGAKEPRQRTRLKSSSGYLVNDQWQFEGTFENVNPPAEGWSFVVRIDVDQEGSGTKTVIPIEDLSAAGCDVVDLGDGQFEVKALPGISVVSFTGCTEKVPVLDPSRVKMKMLTTLVTGTTEERANE